MSSDGKTNSSSSPTAAAATAALFSQDQIHLVAQLAASSPFDAPNEHNVATFATCAEYEKAEALSALLNTFVFSRLFRLDSIKVGVMDEFVMTSGATHLTAAAITEEMQRLALTGSFGVRATMVDPAQVNALGSRSLGICLEGIVSNCRRPLFEQALERIEKKHLRGIICRVRYSMREGDALPHSTMLFPLFPALLDIKVKRFWNRAAWGVRSGLVHQIGEVRRGIHRKARANVEALRGGSSATAAAAALVAGSQAVEAEKDKKKKKRPFCSTNEYYVAVTQDGLPISRIWIGAAPTIFVFWATWDEGSCKFMRDWYTAWGHAESFFYHSHHHHTAAAAAAASSSSSSSVPSQQRLQHDPWLVWCARWLDPSDLDLHAVRNPAPALGADDASIAKHMHRFFQRAGFLIGELQQAGRIIRSLCQVVFVSCDLDRQAAADFVSDLIKDVHVPKEEGDNSNTSGRNGRRRAAASPHRSRSSSSPARARSSSPSNQHPAAAASGSGSGSGSGSRDPAPLLRRSFNSSYVRTSHYWAGPECSAAPLCTDLDIRTFPTIVSATNTGTVHAVHEFPPPHECGPEHMARLDAHVLVVARELSEKKMRRKVQRQQQLLQQHTGMSATAAAAALQNTAGPGTQIANLIANVTIGGGGGSTSNKRTTMLLDETARTGVPQNFEQMVAMDASMRRGSHGGDLDFSVRLPAGADSAAAAAAGSGGGGGDVQQHFLQQIFQLQQQGGAVADASKQQKQQRSVTLHSSIPATAASVTAAAPPINHSFWHNKLTPKAREHIITQLRIQLDLFDTPVTLTTEHRLRFFSNSQQQKDKAMLGRCLVQTQEELDNGYIDWGSRQRREDIKVKLPDEFASVATETSFVSLRGMLTQFQFERIAPLLKLLWLHFSSPATEDEQEHADGDDDDDVDVCLVGSADTIEQKKLRGRSSTLYRAADEHGEVLREGLSIDLDCVMCCPAWEPWHANISVFNAVASNTGGNKNKNKKVVISSLSRNEIICCNCKHPVQFLESSHFQCLHCVQLRTTATAAAAPGKQHNNDSNADADDGGGGGGGAVDEADPSLPPTVLCWSCGISHHNKAHVLLWLPGGDEYNEPVRSVWGPGNVNALPRLRNGEAAFSTTGMHTGIYCDSCRACIKGVRWKCSICYDIDLCDVCFTEHVVDNPKWGAADGACRSHFQQQSAAAKAARAQKHKEAGAGQPQLVSCEEMPSIHGGESRDGRRRLCHFSHVFLRIASPAMGGNDSSFILPEVRRVTMSAGLQKK